MPNPHYRYNRLIHSKVLRTLAKAVTFIFHPVFMPLIVTFLIYFISPVSFESVNHADKLKVFGDNRIAAFFASIAINTILFPLVTVFLLKKLNFIPSVYMHSNRERTIPLIATMVFYFWPYLIMKNLNVDILLRSFFLGNFWGLVVVFMINIFTKVSLHTAAAGGMIGVLAVMMIQAPANLFIPLLLTIIVAGCIGTSRLILQAHRPKDIYIGYLVGIVVQIAAYFFLLKWA